MKAVSLTNQTMKTIDITVLIVYARVGRQHIQRSNVTSSQGHETNKTINRTQNYYLEALNLMVTLKRVNSISYGFKFNVTLNGDTKMCEQYEY